ncbi:hypothetical protein AX15_005720 [Amanita polypyramis BW_CC]|nr:hypothetical protein AX15_005720 [Amanita polypyramis BW_CC]
MDDAVDHNYLISRREQYKQVFPSLEIIGWYTVTSYPTARHIAIHEQFTGFCSTPLLLLLQPGATLGSGNSLNTQSLPFKAYEPSVEIRERTSRAVYIEVPYTVETGEAERIAVDWTAKGGGTSTSLETHLQTQRSAVKMLHDRLLVLVKYVTEVIAGEAQKDHTILRSLSALVASLPATENVAFREEFDTEYEDVQLTAVLSSLTTSTNILNDATRGQAPDSLCQPRRARGGRDAQKADGKAGWFPGRLGPPALDLTSLLHYDYEQGQTIWIRNLPSGASPATCHGADQIAYPAVCMMSEHIRSQPVGFDAYPNYQKGFGTWEDFFISTSTEPDAPQPEQFESDLDSITGLDSAVIASVFTLPGFVPIHSNNNTPSVFTSSSDSTYDTLSTLSETLCNPNSPYPVPTFSLVDLEMDLSHVHPRVGSDYASGATLSSIDNSTDPISFGTLPPTPPRSPINCGNKVYDGTYASAGYFSAGGNAVSTDAFFPPLNYGATNMSDPTVSPLNVSTSPTMAITDEQKMDSRRKHKCPKCTRAFARAFNLKTHMATHDPNRLKPYTCHHRNCGRSFSRKHDLGRHLTSIHRDEVKQAIGVNKAGRIWCDNCGKGFIGRSSTACGCLDIK